MAIQNIEVKRSQVLFLPALERIRPKGMVSPPSQVQKLSRIYFDVGEGYTFHILFICSFLQCHHFRMVRNCDPKNLLSQISTNILQWFCHARVEVFKRFVWKTLQEYIYISKSDTSVDKKGWYREVGYWHCPYGTLDALALNKHKILQTYFVMLWTTFYNLMTCCKFKIHLLHLDQSWNQIWPLEIKYVHPRTEWDHVI